MGGAGASGDGGSGGDGGDGGVHAYSGAGAVPDGDLTGGDGTDGQNGSGAGGGGGGGAGGYGIEYIGSGAIAVDTGQDIRGGDGGDGGNGAGGGNGGDGGIGVHLSTGTVLTNSGAIRGGDGGIRGRSYWGYNRVNGAGGAGVAGSGIGVVNTGTISGGSGKGAQTAVRFSAGTNALELQQGSQINGDVVADGVDDTLILGGGADSTFDVGQLGSGRQYRGFEHLRKEGGGTWTLAGSNAFTGDVTVAAGALAGDTDTLTGDITNNARVIFEQGANGSYAGDMSGGGSLEKRGAGTLTLTGGNAYAGGTTVSDGRLVMGSADSLADATAYVVNGGTLDLSGHDLTASSLTGTDGTVAVSSATLTVDQVVDTVYAGTITGNGGLHKAGTGVLTLSGDSTHTGTAVVSDGRLVVNGRIPGAKTTVEQGGTLAGSGTVGTTSVADGGTMAPGNSIGALSVDGDFHIAGGGVYSVETDAAGNGDRLVISGTAALDGRLVIRPGGGGYGVATEYTILTADGGVRGTFNRVDSTLAFLTPEVRYGENDVGLSLLRNDITLSDVARTDNQRAVSRALERQAGRAGGVTPIIGAVYGMNASGARKAYRVLNGVQYTAPQMVALQQAQQFNGVVSARMNGAGMLAPDPGMDMQPSLAGGMPSWVLRESAANAPAGTGGPASRGLWARTTGSRGYIDGTAEAPAADYRARALTVGADTRWSPTVVLGMASGYARTDTDTEDAGFDTDSVHVAGYGRWSRGMAYVDGVAGVARHRTDATRQVNLAGAGGSATADYDAIQWSASVEAGHRFVQPGGTAATPYVGLGYDRTDRDAFTESGAGTANLRVEEEAFTSVRSRLGIRINGSFDTDGGTSVTPAFGLGWSHEFGERSAVMTASFERAPGTSFAVEGTELERDRLLVHGGIGADYANGSSLRLQYMGSISGSDRHHSLSLTYRLRW
ncbi:autotransporter domain-containing protein [Arhodomonas sp. KWT]|uniref:autotransporter outer membrane beta-barrel domain-containing protein n=1 Tax=Arhodomonas sp. KWT TaxID=2679915 RepID=UPI00196A0B88|nr:autotransporter domain-containing protein [Arhodomonas sp. KWT]